MSNIPVKDSSGSDKFLKATGAGSDGDPYVPIQDVSLTNTSIDVNVQDRTSHTLILPMVQQLGLSTVASQTTIDSRVITVADGSGFTVGNHVRIINSAADRYYFGRLLSKSVNDLTLDSPIDFAYVVGSEVTYSNQNLNVDGSATPVSFVLRTGAPSIPSTVHITRMIIAAECTGAVSLDTFGDISALTNGMILRTLSTATHNIWNIKKNADFVNLAYDFDVYSATNPIQGRNGFAWRLSFNGDDKMGAVLRVPQDGNIELLVQDDLTDLIELRVVLEGHVEVV